MKIIKLLITITLFAFFLSGCVLTKIATVPVRLTGAVISIIPVAGNKADKVLDKFADTIDEIPI